MEEWKPFGGASTFGEVEAWQAAQEKTYAVNDLSYEFQSIVDNIWKREDIDVLAKARLIASAAGDLKSRVGQVANKSSIVDRLKATLGMNVVASVKDLTDADEKAVSGPATMTVFKDNDDRYRYVAVATNKFRDKQGEVFSPEAHREYVKYVDETKDYPELWIWHEKGTRIGVADCIYYDHETGFRVSTGTFDEGMDDVAEKLAGMPELAMSHGYIYRKSDLKGGVYGRYRTFEETVLPAAKFAANEGTSFMAAREADMAAPDEKRKFMENLLGAERFANLEASLGSRAAEMTDAELAMAVKEALAAPAAVGATAPTPAPPSEPIVVAKVDEPVDMVKAVQDSLPGIVATGLKEVMAPVTEALAEIKTWRETVDAALAELKVTDDAKVASMFGLRGLDMSQIVPPADDPANVVKTKAAKDAIAAGGGGKDGDEPQASPVEPILAMLIQDLAPRGAVTA